MRKQIAYLAGGGAILLMLLTLAIGSYQPMSASPSYSIPTTIPDLPGPPGDFVGRTDGGIYHGGVAIQGGANEQQFVIVANSTQTALTPVAEVQNYDGDSIIGVNAGGSGSQTGGINILVPTAQATAYPGVVINNKAAGANSLSIRNNATPVFSVGKTGTVSIGSDSFSGAIKYGSATITTTGYITIAHGLSGSPSVALIQCTTAGYTMSVTSVGAYGVMGYGSGLAGQTVYWIAGK